MKGGFNVALVDSGAAGEVTQDDSAFISGLGFYSRDSCKPTQYGPFASVYAGSNNTGTVVPVRTQVCFDDGTLFVGFEFNRGAYFNGLNLLSYKF